MDATFLPKIFEDKAGSGCHLNFSLWREEEDISGDGWQPNANLARFSAL